MFLDIIFVITFGCTILYFLLFLSQGKMGLPHYKWLDITKWYFFIPIFFYQVYWWSTYLNLI